MLHDCRPKAVLTTVGLYAAVQAGMGMLERAGVQPLPQLQVLNPGETHALRLANDAVALGDVRPELLRAMQPHDNLWAASVRGQLHLRDYRYLLEAEDADAASTGGAQPLRAPRLQALLWAFNMHGYYGAVVDATALGHRVTADGAVIELGSTETRVDVRHCSPEAAELVQLCLREAVGSRTTVANR